MFTEFLLRLLEGGAAVLARPPLLQDGERAAVSTILADAFASRALDVAGRPIDFDSPAAMAAAECVAKACWFLVSRGDTADVIERALAMARPTDSPASHLSTDIVLRFLPAVHRRARALAADDVLTRSLEKLLRQWPLTGVLADIADAPLCAPGFAGHTGLQLLYAERLASHFRPAWVTDGPERPYIELVFAERGLRVPVSADPGVAV